MDNNDHTTTFTLPIAERVFLALEAAVMRFEQRDGFLSDDDLLDIAGDFTVSDLRSLDDADWDPANVDDADFRQLLDILFAVVFPEA